MTRVEYAARALGDLDRLTDFLLLDAPLSAEQTAGLILGAIEMLQQHPLIGQVRRGKKRELVISRGKAGYVALYRYDARLDLVLVLTIRHQREFL